MEGVFIISAETESFFFRQSDLFFEKPNVVWTEVIEVFKATVERTTNGGQNACDERSLQKSVGIGA